MKEQSSSGDFRDEFLDLLGRTRCVGKPPISSACLRLRRRPALCGSGEARVLKLSERTQRPWPNGFVDDLVPKSMRRPSRQPSYGYQRRRSRTTIPIRRPTCVCWQTRLGKMQPRRSAKLPSGNQTTLSPYLEQPVAAARVLSRSRYRTPSIRAPIRAPPLSRCPGDFDQGVRRRLSCSIGILVPGSVIRSSVQRADSNWVHGRGRDLRAAKLLDSTVVVAGCGSVGAPVACTLAQAGAGRIVLVDHDDLELAKSRPASAGCHGSSTQQGAGIGRAAAGRLSPSSDRGPSLRPTSISCKATLNFWRQPT